MSIKSPKDLNMNSSGCNPGFKRNNPFTTLNGLNIFESFNHFMVVIVFHFLRISSGVIHIESLRDFFNEKFQSMNKIFRLKDE